MKIEDLAKKAMNNVINEDKRFAFDDEDLALLTEFHRLIIKEIREQVALYVYSEGCSCCQDVAEHEKALSELGRLLGCPMYSDGSGYDFDAKL